MINLLLFLELLLGYTFIHNLSIYLVARMYGVGIEKFYLFFDYKFALFKRVIGETEFGLGWIPTGGYVKIVGMEIEEGEEMKPHYFQNLPFFKKFILLAIGPLSNLTIAMLIYSIFLLNDLSLFISRLGLILLVIVGFSIICKVFSSFKIGGSSDQKAQRTLLFFVLFALYTLSLILIASCISAFFPIHDFFDSFLHFNLGHDYFGDQALERDFSFFAILIGLILFFFNLLPLSGTIGFSLLKTIYTSCTGAKIPEKNETVFALFSLPIMLFIFGSLVYQLFT